VALDVLGFVISGPASFPGEWAQHRPGGCRCGSEILPPFHGILFPGGPPHALLEPEAQDSHARAGPARPRGE
jgi:hypothetical protein